jgi:hypothetical protein
VDVGSDVGSGVGVGVGVGVGLAGADDGGAVVEAVAVGVAEGLVAEGLVAEGLAEGLAVALGEAELLVGAGDGGPKQPESVSRAQTPRTVDAESPGLAMTPPWKRARFCGYSPPTVRRSSPFN